ncbi:MAG: BolA family protein [Rickettsiaceae bacterium]
MSRLKRIEQKLSVLKAQYLQIINDSSLHDHHSTSPNNGESHFTIKIKVNSIASEGLIKQHKIINKLLKEEFANGLHALSIIIIK